MSFQETPSQLTKTPGKERKPPCPDSRLRPNLKKRTRMDRFVRRVVMLSGATVILAILGIFLVILLEVYPLFISPKAKMEPPLAFPSLADALVSGVDEFREIAYVVNRDGIRFVSLKERKLFPITPIAELKGANITSASEPRNNFLVLGLSDGNILPMQIHFDVTFSGADRHVQPRLEASQPLEVWTDGGPVTQLAHTGNESEKIIAVPVDQNKVHLIFIEERQTLMGGKKVTISRKDASPPIHGKLTALVIDERGEGLFIGTTSGQILRGNLHSEPVTFETLAATSNPDTAVTQLGFLLGDRTLIVGDASGGVTSWLLLRDSNNNLKLRKNHSFLAHGGPVRFFSASQRHKGFLTGEDAGGVNIHFATTGETQLTLQHDLNSPILRGAYLSPKSDGMLSVDASGKIYNWEVDNPYPETTFKSLFGKTWYEGYSKSEYVWQSTGGTDDFEPKFSLVPLIFGTLKGTLYAMLFAGPLALLGAFYHSQFMHPKIRSWVKPFIEIMAALPSVVLGFLAGLWLAPVLEKMLPGIVLTPLIVVLFIVLAVILWDLSPLGLRKICKEGYEIFGFILIVLAGVGVAFYLGGKFESAFLHGDYRLWLNSALGVSYDQRNAVVVGLAMGFAVIPMIYTISEDALSNVPKHLTASSLALGATPWQTALYVVLPTASPGIFSAMMIGFGRAIGETMIVLMATGNTPVMEWNIFNGFRALSANIAVELPEAPEGGTLFRVLFLAAFLLFLMTFTVNTLAEWIRLRLRERYQTL